MQRIKEDIKNNSFHNLYLLYGEEQYLIKMYRDNLKQSVLADSDNMNYSYFEGKDIDVASVREMADTLPFFSDYRVIVIENSDFMKTSSDLADYVDAMPESTVMIFCEKNIDKRNKLFKYINKNGIAAEMKQMSSDDIKKWVAMVLSQNGKQIRESTATYLLAHTDNSMINLKNELDKLIAYTDDRREITVEDIDAVCSVQIVGHIFQMIDAIALGKKSETLRLYNDLLELRESPMSILYMIMRHFNILLQVISVGNLSKNEIASKVGIPPFTVGKYTSQARRFTDKKIRNILDLCADTEYRFKSGNLGDQIGVELLFVEIMKAM